MKKLLTKILIGVLALTTMLGCLTACGASSSWSGTTMTGWGANDVVGGFIGEKGDYLYYINGAGDNTADNTFGAPVKGALMAVKKDFSHTEIVVPKLFVAQDYNAGLYIYGDYVYYGTPNTDKNSKGEIANTELTFMKSKLDGTENVKLFTLSSLLDEYRIAKNASGEVVIVYNDSENDAINAYNCATGVTTEVVKADAEVAGVNGESLNAVMFANNGSAYQLYYTVTVYAEDYNENKAGDRATATYNKVYGYSVAEGASKEILNGAPIATRLSPATYEIKKVVNGVLYYAETINGTTKTYAFGNDKEIKNADVIADTTLFAEDGGIYTVTDGKIEKVDLYSKTLTQTVALNTGASELLAVNDGFMYFTDAEGCVSRIKLNDVDADLQKVSENSVNTAWYPLTFIGGRMFYCDNSSLGASYLKYVDVSATAVVAGEDSDDDGENDKFYLKGQTFLGVKTESDDIAIAEAKIDAIASELEDGVLPFEKQTDGTLNVQVVIDATTAINGLEISEEKLELLTKYQTAIEKANLYEALDGIRYETIGVDYEVKYNSVKSQIESFRASDDYAEISGYIGNNRLANYDQAVKLFG